MTSNHSAGAPLAVEQLLSQARQVSKNAYSPYSGVQVGAVTVAANGSIFGGCNVENASYGLTQCAERNAMANAMAAGAEPGSLHTMVVFSNGFDALSPCGACRQVMSELMTADATVASCSDGQEPRFWKITELLPDPFRLDK